MAFIAGSYAVTYDPPGAPAIATVGQIQQGVLLEHRVFKEYITGDTMARMRQDAVFQGQDQFVEFRLMEYDATNAASIFWPYGSAWLTLSAVIATLDSANAGSLLLTALAGSPAAAAPATITLPLCILSENFPVSILLAPQLRTIPLRLDVFPNASKVFGTLT